MSTISRREALAIAGSSGASLLFGENRRNIAITIDDIAWSVIPEPFRAEASRRLLSALAQNGNARAQLFIVGQNVDSPEGIAILRQWGEKGHLLSNHTWTHHVYNESIVPSDFAADLLRCDGLIRSFPNFRPYFRFPALKEGSTPERRDFMRGFLRTHGYRNGSVTIDASDWYYDRRLRAALTQDPSFDVTRFRQPYLDHIWSRAIYYDDLARQVLGRSVNHTLLLHFNLLNVLFLADLLMTFRARGWNIIDAETAFQDPVFRREPNTAPAGESLVWALAKETGKYARVLRYPGEDDVYEKPILDRLKL